MKKVLAIILVVMMLAAMAPFALAASVSSITVSVPEIKDLQMTLTKVQDKYSHEAFMFDANQTPYFFYFEKGGTVTFSKKVTLSFVDLKTYETSTKDFEANKAVAVDESFTGASLYYDDATKGFVGFVSLDDTVRGGGAAACSLDINTLKDGAAAAPAASTAPAPAASTAPASAAPAASTAPAAGTSAAPDASATPSASSAADTSATPSASADTAPATSSNAAASSTPAPTDDHPVTGSSSLLMYILLGVIAVIIIVVIIVAVTKKSKNKQENATK